MWEQWDMLAPGTAGGICCSPQHISRPSMYRWRLEPRRAPAGWKGRLRPSTHLTPTRWEATRLGPGPRPGGAPAPVACHVRLRPCACCMPRAPATVRLLHATCAWTRAPAACHLRLDPCACCIPPAPGPVHLLHTTCAWTRAPAAYHLRLDPCACMPGSTPRACTCCARARAAAPMPSPVGWGAGREANRAAAARRPAVAPRAAASGQEKPGGGAGRGGVWRWRG